MNKEKEKIIYHAPKRISNNSSFLNLYKTSELDTLPDAPTEPIFPVATFSTEFKSQQIPPNFSNFNDLNSNIPRSSVLNPGKTKSSRKRSRRRIYSKPRKRNKKKSEFIIENDFNLAVPDRVNDQSFDSDCSSDTIILDDFEDIPLPKKIEAKNTNNCNSTNIKPPVFGKLLISSSMLKTSSPPIVKKEPTSSHSDYSSIHHGISSTVIETNSYSVKKEPIDTDDQILEPPTLIPEIANVYPVNNNLKPLNNPITSVEHIKKEIEDRSYERKISDLPNQSSLNNIVFQRKQTARKRTAPRIELKVIQNTQKQLCEQNFPMENLVSKSNCLLPSQHNDNCKSSHTTEKEIFSGESNTVIKLINQNSKPKVKETNLHNKTHSLKINSEETSLIPINKPSLILQSILEKHNSKNINTKKLPESNKQKSNFPKSNQTMSSFIKQSNSSELLLKDQNPLLELKTSFIALPSSNKNKRSKKAKGSTKKISRKKGNKSQNLNSSLDDNSLSKKNMDAPVNSALFSDQTTSIPPVSCGDEDIASSSGLLNDTLLTKKPSSSKKRKKNSRKWTPKKKNKTLRIETDNIDHNIFLYSNSNETAPPPTDKQEMRYSPEFDEQGVSCSPDFIVNTSVADSFETHISSVAQKQSKNLSKNKSRKKPGSAQSKKKMKNNLKHSNSGACFQNVSTEIDTSKVLEGNVVISNNKSKSQTNVLNDAWKFHSIETPNKLIDKEKTDVTVRDPLNIYKESDTRASSIMISLSDQAKSSSTTIPSISSGFQSNVTNLQSNKNVLEPVYNLQNIQRILNIKKEPEDIENSIAIHSSQNKKETDQKVKTKNNSHQNDLSLLYLGSKQDSNFKSNVNYLEKVTVKKEISSDDDCSIIEIIEAPSKTKPTKQKKDPILSRLEDIDIISNEILLSSRSETKRLRNELRLAGEISVSSDAVRHPLANETPSCTSSFSHSVAEIPGISNVAKLTSKVLSCTDGSSNASGITKRINKSTNISNKKTVLETKEDEQVIMNLNISSLKSSTNNNLPSCGQSLIIKKETCSDDEDIPLSSFKCKTSLKCPEKCSEKELKSSECELEKQTENLNISVENSGIEKSSANLHSIEFALKPSSNTQNFSEENLPLNSVEVKNSLKCKYSNRLNLKETLDEHLNKVDKMTHPFLNVLEQTKSTSVNAPNFVNSNDSLPVGQENSLLSLNTKYCPEKLDSTHCSNSTGKQLSDLSYLTLNTSSKEISKNFNDVPENSQLAKHNTCSIVFPSEKTSFSVISKPLMPAHLIKKEKDAIANKVILSKTFSEKIIDVSMKSDKQVTEENFHLIDGKKVNEHLSSQSICANVENRNLPKEISYNNKMTSFSNCLNSGVSNESISHSDVDKVKNDDGSNFSKFNSLSASVIDKNDKVEIKNLETQKPSNFYGIVSKYLSSIKFNANIMSENKDKTCNNLIDSSDEFDTESFSKSDVFDSTALPRFSTASNLELNARVLDSSSPWVGTENSSDSFQTHSSTVSYSYRNNDLSASENLMNFNKNSKNFLKYLYPGNSFSDFYKYRHKCKGKNYTRSNLLSINLSYELVASKLQVAASIDSNRVKDAGDTNNLVDFALVDEEIECYHRLINVAPSHKLISMCYKPEKKIRTFSKDPSCNENNLTADSSCLYGLHKSSIPYLGEIGSVFEIPKSNADFFNPTPIKRNEDIMPLSVPDFKKEDFSNAADIFQLVKNVKNYLADSEKKKINPKSNDIHGNNDEAYHILPSKENSGSTECLNTTSSCVTPVEVPSKEQFSNEILEQVSCLKNITKSIEELPYHHNYILPFGKSIFMDDGTLHRITSEKPGTASSSHNNAIQPTKEPTGTKVLSTCMSSNELLESASSNISGMQHLSDKSSISLPLSKSCLLSNDQFHSIASDQTENKDPSVDVLSTEGPAFTKALNSCLLSTKLSESTSSNINRIQNLSDMCIPISMSFSKSNLTNNDMFQTIVSDQTETISSQYATPVEVPTMNKAIKSCLLIEPASSSISGMQYLSNICAPNDKCFSKSNLVNKNELYTKTSDQIETSSSFQADMPAKDPTITKTSNTYLSSTKLVESAFSNIDRIQQPPDLSAPTDSFSKLKQQIYQLMGIPNKEMQTNISPQHNVKEAVKNIYSVIPKQLSFSPFSPPLVSCAPDFSEKCSFDYKCMNADISSESLLSADSHVHFQNISNESDVISEVTLSSTLRESNLLASLLNAENLSLTDNPKVNFSNTNPGSEIDKSVKSVTNSLDKSELIVSSPPSAGTDSQANKSELNLYNIEKSELPSPYISRDSRFNSIQANKIPIGSKNTQSSSISIGINNSVYCLDNKTELESKLDVCASENNFLDMNYVSKETAFDCSKNQNESVTKPGSSLNSTLNFIDVPKIELLKILQAASDINFNNASMPITPDHNKTGNSFNTFDSSHDSNCNSNVQTTTANDINSYIQYPHRNYWSNFKVPVVHEYYHKPPETTYNFTNPEARNSFDFNPDSKCNEDSSDSDAGNDSELLPECNIENLDADEGKRKYDTADEKNARCDTDERKKSDTANENKKIDLSSSSSEKFTKFPPYKSKWEKIMERKALEEQIKDKSKNYSFAKKHIKSTANKVIIKKTDSQNAEKFENNESIPIEREDDLLSFMNKQNNTDDNPVPMSTLNKRTICTETKSKISNLSNKEVLSSFKNKKNTPLKAKDSYSERNQTSKEKKRVKHPNSVRCDKKQTPKKKSMHPIQSDEYCSNLFTPDQIIKKNNLKTKDVSISKNKVEENKKIYGRVTNRGSFLTQSTLNHISKTKSTPLKKISPKCKAPSIFSDEIHSKIMTPDIAFNKETSILPRNKYQKNFLKEPSTRPTIDMGFTEYPRKRNSLSTRSDISLSPESGFMSPSSDYSHVSSSINYNSSSCDLPNSLHEPISYPRIEYTVPLPNASNNKSKSPYTIVSPDYLPSNIDNNISTPVYNSSLLSNSSFDFSSSISKSLNVNESSPSISHSSPRFIQQKNKQRVSKSVSLAPRHIKDSVGCSTFDTKDVLLLILGWNCDWLTQQRKNSAPPPISKTVNKANDSYDSFEKYYNTYFPLLLLETWQRIYVSWNHLHSAPPYICEITSYVQEQFSFKVECQTIFNPAHSNRGLFPEEGNIILVRLGNANKIESDFSTLGYVTNVKFRAVIDSVDSQSKCYQYLKGSPSDNLQLLQMSFLGAITSKDLELASTIHIHVLCNVKINLKQNDALLKVKNSPLSKNILNPLEDELRVVNMINEDMSDEDKLGACVKEIVKGILSPHPIPIITIVKAPPSSDHLLVLSPLINRMRDSYETKVILCARTAKGLIDIGLNLDENNIKFVVTGKKADVPQKLKKYLVEELATSRALTEQMFVEKNQGSVCKDNLKQEYFVNAKISILSECDVILSLIKNCHDDNLEQAVANDGRVSQLCCIIDEANLCTEPEILIPILFGVSKLILIGNPDIDARVCSKTAVNFGYNKSLFHRAFELDLRNL